jgi:hypothetical protein
MNEYTDEMAKRIYIDNFHQFNEFNLWISIVPVKIKGDPLILNSFLEYFKSKHHNCYFNGMFYKIPNFVIVNKDEEGFLITEKDFNNQLGILTANL